MRDPEWPDGVRCAACDRNISDVTEPKVPEEIEDGISVILCIECYTDGSYGKLRRMGLGGPEDK